MVPRLFAMFDDRAEVAVMTVFHIEVHHPLVLCDFPRIITHDVRVTQASEDVDFLRQLLFFSL